MVFLFGNPPAYVFSLLTAKDAPALSSNPGFSNPHVPVLLGWKRPQISRSPTLNPRPPLSHDSKCHIHRRFAHFQDGNSRFPRPPIPKPDKPFGEASLLYLVPVRLHVHRPLVSVTILFSLLPKIPRDVPVHDRLHDGDALREKEHKRARRVQRCAAAPPPRGPSPAGGRRGRTFTLPPESGPNSAILLNILPGGAARRRRRPRPPPSPLPPPPPPRARHPPRLPGRGRAAAAASRGGTGPDGPDRAA